MLSGWRQIDGPCGGPARRLERKGAARNGWRPQDRMQAGCRRRAGGWRGHSGSPLKLATRSCFEPPSLVECVRFIGGIGDGPLPGGERGAHICLDLLVGTPEDLSVLSARVARKIAAIERTSRRRSGNERTQPPGNSLPMRLHSPPYSRLARRGSSPILLGEGRPLLADDVAHAAGEVVKPVSWSSLLRIETENQ